MMTWSDQRTRIRRFLRDPDGLIWSDALLLRLYNDEQNDLQNICGHIEDAQVVRVPSGFQNSYTHDFEWAFSGHGSGEVFLFGYTDDYIESTATNVWEIQESRGISPDVPSLGNCCSHPWEAWIATPNEQPPVYFPSGFYRAMAVFFDKTPLEPITMREIQSADPSWRNREGLTSYYYRDEEYTNRAYLYPRPSAIEWQDDYDMADAGVTDIPTTMSETKPTVAIVRPSDNPHNNGKVSTIDLLGTASDMTGVTPDPTWACPTCTPTSGTVDSFYSLSGLWRINNLVLGEGYNTVTVTAYNAALESGSDSVTIFHSTEPVKTEDDPDSADYAPAGLDVDKNLLVVFEKDATELSDDTDKSDFHEFLVKYIEAGVISSAYRMNTDGRIESLADYWLTRKNIGINIIKKFLSRRHQDRVYAMGPAISQNRRRRHPRLPDSYPDVNR